MKNILLVNVWLRAGFEKSHTFAQIALSSYVLTITYYIWVSVS